MLNAQVVHRRARRVLPEGIQTSGIALEDETPAGLAALLFPFRRPSSGTVVFRLCEASARELRANPKAFLHDALVARESLGRFGRPAHYKPWRHVVAQMGEAWFTTRLDGRGVIVVIPEEARVIYLWRD